MDYKGVIDFNKYTLALAAGGLVYSFERLPDFKSGFPIFVLLLLLFLFAIALVLAVLVFAAATRSLHLPDERKGELDGVIGGLGTSHAIALFVAIVILSVTMLIHSLVQLKNEDVAPLECCVKCIECG